MQLANLEKTPGKIWQCLTARQGAWRIPVLASSMPGGGADARTVVLRLVYPAERELIFFTDLRSRKLAQLEADAGICVVIHDEQRNLQVRLYGWAAREQSAAILDHWWDNLPVHQRRIYTNDRAYANDIVPGEKEPDYRQGRENSTAFRVIVDRFHCLWIGDMDNEAAEFTWHDERWHGQRVLA